MRENSSSTDHVGRENSRDARCDSAIGFRASKFQRGPRTPRLRSTRSSSRNVTAHASPGSLRGPPLQKRRRFFFCRGCRAQFSRLWFVDDRKRSWRKRSDDSRSRFKFSATRPFHERQAVDQRKPRPARKRPFGMPPPPFASIRVIGVLKGSFSPRRWSWSAALRSRERAGFFWAVFSVDRVFGSHDPPRHLHSNLSRTMSVQSLLVSHSWR